MVKGAPAPARVGDHPQHRLGGNRLFLFQAVASLSLFSLVVNKVLLVDTGRAVENATPSTDWWSYPSTKTRTVGKLAGDDDDEYENYGDDEYEDDDEYEGDDGEADGDDNDDDEEDTPDDEEDEEEDADDSPDIINVEYNSSTCGVYYFYHIGKTGGKSVSEWLRKVHLVSTDVSTRYRDLDMPTIGFIDFWDSKNRETKTKGHGKNETFVPKWSQLLQNTQGMVETIIHEKRKQQRKDNTKPSWIAIHHHHRAPGLHYMMPQIRQWKQDLQKEGCQLILATVLREPASRLISKVFYGQVPEEKFSTFVQSKPDGQALYLLYNFCDRQRYYQPNQSTTAITTGNSSRRYEHVQPILIHSEQQKNGTDDDRVEDLSELPDCYPKTFEARKGKTITDQEVHEVLEYLNHDFDIIGQTKTLDRFFEETISKTGWSRKLTGHGALAKHKNKSTKAYNLTQEMIQMVNDAVQDDVKVLDLFFKANSKFNNNNNSDASSYNATIIKLAMERNYSVQAQMDDIAFWKRRYTNAFDNARKLMNPNKSRPFDQYLWEKRRSNKERNSRRRQKLKRLRQWRREEDDDDDNNDKIDTEEGEDSSKSNRDSKSSQDNRKYLQPRDDYATTTRQGIEQQKLRLEEVLAKREELKKKKRRQYDHFYQHRTRDQN